MVLDLASSGWRRLSVCLVWLLRALTNWDLVLLGCFCLYGELVYCHLVILFCVLFVYLTNMRGLVGKTPWKRNGMMKVACLFFCFIVRHVGGVFLATTRRPCSVFWSGTGFIRHIGASLFTFQLGWVIGHLFAKHICMGVVLGVAQLSYGMIWFAGRVIWDFTGRSALVLQICWDLILALIVASMFSGIRWFHKYYYLRLRYRGLHGQLR